MGREERTKKQLRLLEWSGNDLDRNAFAVSYEAITAFRPERDDEDKTESVIARLDEISVEKGPHPSSPDWILRTLDGPARVEITEAEREVLLKSIRTVRWNGFVLRRKRRAVEILENAPPVETAPPVEAATSP